MALVYDVDWSSLHYVYPDYDHVCKFRIYSLYFLYEHTHHSRHLFQARGEVQKMRRFHFGKLVRDNIVEQITSNGDVPHWKELSQQDYIEELKKKIGEEAAEVEGATSDEILKEVADVQELIHALLEALHVSKEELEAIQEKKNEKAGAFQKKQYIAYVDVQDDSPWLGYYLKSPEKYPEVRR